ncbi:unnamed protein product [Linum trigynum]|uniref:Uncharacterized protein n=1 Tax=Linum trigynum TaxID=586398 RepID=A0AAV2CU66_9ROSI
MAAQTPTGTPRTPASSPIICDDEDVVMKGKLVVYYWEENPVVKEEKLDDDGREANGVGAGKFCCIAGD